MVPTENWKIGIKHTVLDQLLKYLDGIQDEIPLNIADNQLSIMVVDPPHIRAVEIVLPKTALEALEGAGMAVVDVQRLKNLRALQMPFADTTILAHNGRIHHAGTLRYSAGGVPAMLSGTIPYSDPFMPAKWPSYVPPWTITMDVARIYSWLIVAGKEADPEHVEIKATHDQVWMTCGPHVLNLQTGRDVFAIKHDDRPEISCKLGLQYLMPILANMPAGWQEYQLGQNHPMMVQHDWLGGKVRHVMAPRIEND